MVRVNLVLAAVLVVCALGLVSSQDRARKLFGDVERAHAHAARLEVQWNQLQIEQTALAKASRIDTKARGELAMESISPQRTLHLVVDPIEHIVRLGSTALESDVVRPAPAPGSAAPTARKRPADRSAAGAPDAHTRTGGARRNEGAR